jgi:hypothetical protein
VPSQLPPPRAEGRVLRSTDRCTHLMESPPPHRSSGARTSVRATPPPPLWSARRPHLTASPAGPVSCPCRLCGAYNIQHAHHLEGVVRTGREGWAVEETAVPGPPQDGTTTRLGSVASEADRSPSISAEVKKTWIYTATAPSTPLWRSA